jgi:hypothetical protein
MTDMLLPVASVAEAPPKITKTVNGWIVEIPFEQLRRIATKRFGATHSIKKALAASPGPKENHDNL